MSTMLNHQLNGVGLAQARPSINTSHFFDDIQHSLVPYGFDRYRADQSTKFGTVIP